MSRVVTVCSVQLAPIPFDPERSRATAEAEITRLATAFPDVDLFVLPELFPTGEDPFGPGEPDGFTASVAEPIPGPTTERFGALARRIGRWVVPGSILERADDGRIHNTALVFAPDGTLASAYRKLFPWRPFEKTAPGDGEGRIVQTSSIGTLGLLICYDGWFPEVARGLALEGAELLIQPTLTATSDREEEIVLARANAIANQCFVVNPNAVTARGGGRSVVIDPSGTLLTELGDREAFAIDVLDLDAVAVARDRGLRGVSRPWRMFLEEAPAAVFEPYRRVSAFERDRDRTPPAPS